MSKHDDVPPESLEDVRKRLENYGNEAFKDLFKPFTDEDFEERGPLSGSAELLRKTDAELFPDELEEYSSEERKPRLVHSKK